jgi:hypothetical protein
MFKFKEWIFMSKRLNFGQDFRKRQAKYGLNVKDEAEWMENDAAARWLQKNENRALRKADHRLSDQQTACSAMKLPRRKSLKPRHAAIDPCDPYDRLAGVDMRRAPWR